MNNNNNNPLPSVTAGAHSFAKSQEKDIFICLE
jgi:hypothetical protein